MNHYQDNTFSFSNSINQASLRGQEKEDFTSKSIKAPKFNNFTQDESINSNMMIKFNERRTPPESAGVSVSPIMKPNNR